MGKGRLSVLCFLLLFVWAIDSGANKNHIKIGVDQIKAIYINFIKNNMPWKKQDVQITNIEVKNAITLPGSNWSYEVITPKGCNYLGRVSLAIRFKSGGKSELVRVIGEVKVFKKVIYAKHFIRKHQVIKKEDIKLLKRDISHLPQNIITEIKEVIGKKATHSIYPGRIITKNFLESVSTVKRGDVVTVIVESDTLKITTKGIAKEKGQPGDVIKVINIDTKKVIYAKVANNSMVKVEF
ncbi:flagellar basal body P-ring formation protein FlgA [Candidatus Desulfofervidus auxilii]|uniref:Flagella basal body P-ring formation protein FlgA n=1 Tax=Desulfofervidus auxilii TaxID=1621989 RepID=A0A7U4QJL2_DESA2|nr:flagellar basal body P-ring formation chaperone FlgA [Candidatus Desulfofervidus auxilii]AMM40562.1 flagellar basal body P-ring formation protein FlgA [Candidatus Desulfofervidus auxilii]